jgi:hypothetical protein
LPKIKGYFWPFNIGFLAIISWGQRYSDLSIIKKKWLTLAEHAPTSERLSFFFGGARGTSQWSLVAFRGTV